MCDNCKKDCEYGRKPQTIDWSKIPDGLNEVRLAPTGSLWASPQFRVHAPGGTPDYSFKLGTPAATLMWDKLRIVATRPESKTDYLVHAPGLIPSVLKGLTRVQLHDYLAKAGYGPQVAVYKLTLVAESKQVEVKTVQTQLVWSN